MRSRSVLASGIDLLLGAEYGKSRTVADFGGFQGFSLVCNSRPFCILSYGPLWRDSARDENARVELSALNAGQAWSTLIGGR